MLWGHLQQYVRIRQDSGWVSWASWTAVRLSGSSGPTVHISRYLPAAALTRLLASSRWKALALDPAGNDAFTGEVRRTAEPSYTWNPYPYWRYVEPLARALQREVKGPQADARETEFRRKHHMPDPPPRPGEVIESGDLCHHS